MSFTRIQKMPSVEEILEMLPLSDKLKNIKKLRDDAIRKIFTGEDSRLLVIIGPCSAHDEGAVCDYISRLAALQERVEERVLLVPRIYTNKPRTTGSGYKGMGHQPNPQEEPDMVEGLKAIRRLHIKALGETHLSAADEMLYPENYSYLEDILSYVAIGARSVENQQHRLTVSGLDIPIGMKNPTSGDVTVMLNSIQAAQLPHVFTYNGWAVSTDGNPLAHGILRGAVNQFGQSISNYHYEDLIRISGQYTSRELANPALLIDTNHANSDKKYFEQPRIAREILESRNNSATLKQMIKGLMIQSFLVEGSQDINENIYGKSITDPCLGWEDSEQLVLEIAEHCE